MNDMNDKNETRRWHGGLDVSKRHGVPTGHEVEGSCGSRSKEAKDNIWPSPVCC